MMLDDVDLLVCGAGPVGCTIAERAAATLGWKVLVVERRPHVAGNCYDSIHSSGVRIHNYGPHYFRTNDEAVLRYLSRFTDWIPGNYVVKSLVNGRLLPFPINLTTLEQFFGCSLDTDAGRRLLDAKRQPIAQPANSEEMVLAKVGRELYEAFYLNYTLKQWGRHPRELAPSVCGRVPVRLNRDERYVDQRFQVMPKDGFTALFTRMLNHRKIRVLTRCDFREIQTLVKPRRATVYSGPIDAYFDHCLGRLPYRSLRFEFETEFVPYRQPCVQINYPNDHSWTRTVEIKHVTGQQHPHTVICYETPRSEGEPYYPVPAAAHQALYERYRDLAEVTTRRERVFFCGRLAQYRYFNTDEVIAEALQCFEKIKQLGSNSFLPSPTTTGRVPTSIAESSADCGRARARTEARRRRASSPRPTMA
ncbi:MAG: UDP-galactopyranose mutase [Gemmataceae bacterium]|nr:UDP-galactopyranose mutase [Gemmataceae bacterium]